MILWQENIALSNSSRYVNNIPIRFVLILFFVIIFIACKEKYTPKPKGYFRIDFPEKKYQPLNKKIPYFFSIPDYAIVEEDKSKDARNFWINIIFPNYSGKIHISYYPVNQNIDDFFEDAHKLAFKHAVKADAIVKKEFIHPENKVYASLYEIQGNVASNIQFTATDSNRHFLRGSLYFNHRPRIDSIQPILNFVYADIVHLLNTLEWRDKVAQ